MNGTSKEKEAVPPITITVSADESPTAHEKKDSHDDGVLTDDDIEFLRARRSGSRKASFFIGDDEHIAVTIVGPDNKEILPDDIVVAPDGGYGYVIVFAAFMTNFIIDGTIFSFGIILDEIIKKSGDRVQADQAAWIGSLLTGFYLMIGPLVSSLCNKIGFRWTGIAGSVIATLGFVLAWYLSGSETDPNMTALFIFYGVIGGIGFGLAYVPSIICVGFYFSKKRALATGIAICGSGIGTFVYAPLVGFLIIRFGWQGSLLVQAGLIFTCVAFAALYRPLKPKNNPARTPNASPEGTPLLMRMKRARELEKWDSVNSFSSSVDGFSTDPSRRSIPNTALLVNGGTTVSMDDTRLKAEILYENARKASANSLPGVQLPQTPKSKKLMVPAAGDIVPPQQRSGSIKNKSFVGLPVTLKEIDEENEASEHGSDKEKKDKVEEVPQAQSTRRSIYLRRNSTLTGVNDALGGRKNSGMTLVLSSSALQPVNEMTQSRILRVATSKTTLNRPLLRDDIFYGGSLNKIPEYKNNVDAVFSSVEWHEPVPRVDSSAFSELPPVQPVKKSKFLVLKKMLDFSLLKSPTFLILSISGAVTMLGFFVPFIYLKSIAGQKMDDPSGASATFLISIIGISNTVARIFCGALADRSFVNPLIINNAALTIGGLATMCVPFMGTHTLFIVYACVFGISVACFASLRSILLVELLGLSKLTNAFGLLCLFQGAAALVGSPLAGFLKVVTGQYRATFYVAGAMMVLSGIMCYPIHYVNNWEKRRADRKLILKNELLNQ